MSSISPQEGNTVSASGASVSPPNTAGTQVPNTPTSSYPMNDNSMVPTGGVSGGGVSTIDDSVGDVLQASTTVAGLAVAIIALFPAAVLSKMTVMTLGHWSLPLKGTLLLCGAMALLSGAVALDKLRRRAQLSVFSMLSSHIGLLYIALLLFLLVYLGVALS